MSGVETLNSQQVTKDATGKMYGMREYRVWGYARTAILGNPNSIIIASGGVDMPLPGYNSPWEGMSLDRYSVNAVGGIFDVTGLYSNDRRFTLPNNPPTLTKSWTGSFQTESIPLPIGVFKNTNSITLVQGGAPLSQTSYGWDFETQDTDHKFERIGQQVYLNEAEVSDALDVIANLADKIHKIRGRYYLFEPGDYAEEADGKWRMQYQWTRDPGTPALPFVNDPFLWLPDDSTANFEYPGGSGQFYSRPPWHKLLLVQTGAFPSSNPTYKIQRVKDHSDLLGWSALPRFTP